MSFGYPKNLSQIAASCFFSGLLLCLTFTQFLAFEHELTHANHEQTEFCEAFKIHGASTDCIVHGGTPLDLPQNQKHESTLINSEVFTTTVAYQRSRAPPFFVSTS